MNYRSIDDMNHCMAANLAKVPAGTDLIVGVPRSGLLAANLLALHLNLPFTDVEGFVEGRILQSGSRLKNYMKPFEAYKQVLVIEDSVWSGQSIEEVKEKLVGLYPDKQIVYTAVFIAPEAVDKVDFYFDVCPGPRIFEWNMMHHELLENCCVDIDGVLCKDPTEEQNDDGPLYEEFLTNVDSHLVPSKTIGCLVTNRLEKYRPQTEAWLARHNIKYKELVMLNLPSKAARLKANNHGGFKASVYIKNDYWLFIESSEWQARQIANLAGKSVYCVDSRKMIYPDAVGKTRGNIRKFLRKALNLF
ncbi:phosphoribosyltransferase family protein [Pontibacter akesuensis]|uniref:Orotate phosphoribosyltransferase n=1 Tax=Pontibacter akesuensis TaxID=388950 RepID=A0A1I7GI04_9BACT|nr:phosphoribosyltransferase family protein [Pontibacter akesuensis]GHA56787.1 phosphoribosyltransferase [Pontibacter akesuensis]SFU47916.1 orotate phosphoribosyltransferase [Pontibacter akesuensis]